MEKEKQITIWKNLPKDINLNDYVGMVYIIENLSKLNNNGVPKFYIGQKKFWFKKTLPPLKGKKNKRKSLKESDWKTYTGSSESLNRDIENGDIIQKTILHLCKTKWEMNYLEALEQFKRNVLIESNSYNGIINIRLGSCPNTIIESIKSDPNKFII